MNIGEIRKKSNNYFSSKIMDSALDSPHSPQEKVFFTRKNFQWKKQLHTTIQQIEQSLMSMKTLDSKKNKKCFCFKWMVEKFFGWFKKKKEDQREEEYPPISDNKRILVSGDNSPRLKNAENIIDVLINRHIDFLGTQKHLHQSSHNWIKAMVVIISDFLQAILSLMSCVLYILSTYVDDNTDHKFLNFIHISDYIITALFTLDLIRHFLESKHKAKFFFKFHSIIDILAILPIYLQLIFNVQQSALGFLHILQIFRIIRILRLYRLFKEYDVEGADKIDNSLNEARFSLQKQIAILICTIFALLFISAGISYELDGVFENTYVITESADNKIFSNAYTFFYAFYLMFQTFFSVGYGDVVANSSSSRILISVLVLLFLFVAVDQILKLVEIKSKTSPWDYEYKHHDHTIIIGMFNENCLLKILQELFKLEYENNIKHVLLIRNNPPSIEIMTLMENPIYEGKISYLQTPLLSEAMAHKANIKKCRNIFLVNESTAASSYQQDKMLVALMHSLQECIPFTPKIMRISHPELVKRFYGNLNHWTPWNKAFSTTFLKSIFMVENIFNKGFTTIFLNFFACNRLLSMEKDLSKNNWYMEYGASLLQEIFCVSMSRFFIGLQFYKAVQILSRSKSKLNSEGLILIGVKTKYSDEEYDTRTTILINPQNYIIKPYDNGYFSIFINII